MPSRFVLLNFAAFQCTWFAAVLGAAAGVGLAGPVCVAIWIMLHLRALGPSWRGEATLLAAAGALGFALDSVLLHAGILDFHPASTFAPPWMTALWLALGATLRHSLAWLSGRIVLAGMFGLVGGPVAYLAGERLGALQVADGWPALLAIGIPWALAMVALVRAAGGALRVAEARS